MGDTDSWHLLCPENVFATLVTDKLKVIYKKKPSDESYTYAEWGQDDLAVQFATKAEVQCVVVVPAEVYFSQMGTEIKLKNADLSFKIKLLATEGATATYAKIEYTYTMLGKLTPQTEDYCIPLKWYDHVDEGDTFKDRVSACDLASWSKLGSNWDSETFLDMVKDLYTNYKNDSSNYEAYAPCDVFTNAQQTKVRMQVTRKTGPTDTTAKEFQCEYVRNK